LTYLNLCYFLVGLDDEYYFIVKGNYLKDLNRLQGAINSYQKALRESKDPRVHLALASCLLHSGRYHEAVPHFEMAYKKLNDPDTALGLAIAEYETGNIDRCSELIQDLEGKNLYLTNDEALKKLKKKIIQTREQQA
jgi:tetratricopeptide (TPR) repeat protein